MTSQAFKTMFTNLPTIFTPTDFTCRLDCGSRKVSDHDEWSEAATDCQWGTGYRRDGSYYRYKISDCGDKDCKYSWAYRPESTDSDSDSE